MGFHPDEGNKYFQVDASVTNNGKDARSFLPSVGLSKDVSVKMTYQNEYEYKCSNLLGYSNELHDTSLNPLSTKTGTIAFEIPDAVAGSQEELLVIFSAGKDSVQIKVR